MGTAWTMATLHAGCSHFWGRGTKTPPMLRSQTAAMVSEAASSAALTTGLQNMRSGLWDWCILPKWLPTQTDADCGVVLFCFVLGVF